eukprot:15705140-Heterocapsa_arctica.AAC.1
MTPEGKMGRQPLRPTQPLIAMAATGRRRRPRGYPPTAAARTRPPTAPTATTEPPAPRHPVGRTDTPEVSASASPPSTSAKATC